MRYYDNTRVSAFKTCPRKYFLRHKLHWTPDRTAAALAFGSSWHAAMDVVWGLIKGIKDNRELHQLAMAKFLEVWVDEGFPEWDDMDLDLQTRLAPRTPGTAAEMLMNYINQRREFLESVEVLAIEQPFAVPIDPEQPDLLYIGRLDKVFLHQGHIYVGEHKTTSDYSKTQGIQPRYIQSYSPNSQVDGYLHALHVLYGKKAKAVWVDAALVHKNVHNVFKFIPIDRQYAALDAWLHETLRWINRIEREEGDYNALDKDMEDNFMRTYMKNDQSCNHWAGCTYRDLCKFWPDPHRHDTPDGFIVKKWEPFKELEIDRLGLEDEA